jgi:hypothetical protein
MKNPLSAVLIGFASLALVCAASSQVIITEFMASNTSGLLDEEGEASDWIEIQNLGAAPVNLLNWGLTDKQNDLSPWRFPATNLNAGAFMVVFASGKNRRVPGATLHTDFGLSAGGEYLVLTKPDGTIATEFQPSFPQQVGNVSYGFGIESTSVTLIGSNAAARVLVPTDANLGALWTLPGFVDSAWIAGTNGVGFDTGVPDPVEDSFANAVATAAPLAWFRFSEASGTVATNLGSLGSAANGTYLGSPTLAQAGPRPPGFGGFEADNAAPRLNGTTARVTVPDVTAFDLGTGPFTIGLWFNPANAAVRGDLFTYKGAGGDFGIHVASSGANTVSLYHDGFIGTGGALVNNTWYYLVCTRDAVGNATVLLNGAILFTGTDTRALNIANDLVIGANHGGTPATVSAPFNGLIDEFALYNRALTTNEVAQQYQTAITAGGSAYTSLIKTDLQTAMAGINSSAYIRIPFVVDDVSKVDRFKLRMRYDDGFVAYINGVEAVSANAADVNAWNAAATARHLDSAATAFVDFDIGDARSALLPGANVLAIHGLNISATNPDFLIEAELIATTFGELGSEPRYFLLPTPGDVNGVGTEDVGPVIGAVMNTPALPVRLADTDDLGITARVTPAFTAIATVTLRWRVMFGVTNSTPMLDPDGDGVYGAVIPASASTPGQMVRYYVTATDTLGRSSRWPLFEDPLGSPEYLGTVVANLPSVTSALPIWEWFAADVAAARTVGGTRGAVFFKERFYDNVRIRRRGAATSNGQKFDFNRGFRCFITNELSDLDEVNLNNEASDPSFIRPPMAWESFRVAGNAACLSFNMLLRVNGGVDRTGIYIEQVDERFLERNELDPEGALYKFIQRGAGTPIFTDPNDGVEKKTRLAEDRSDLAALCAALSLTNTPVNRLAYLMDNLNVPALMTHLACRSITMDSDDVRKNIYMYRDTLGNGEWTIFPWDKDWSFGILGDGGPSLTHPFFGDQSHAKPNGNQWGLLYHAVFNEPKLSAMYLRRLRTVMDQQLQPPGTPASSGYFEQRADAWFRPVFPHVGTGPSNAVYGTGGSIRNFLPGRRTDLYVTFAATNTAALPTNRLVPLGQLPNVAVHIGEIEYNPGSGNQAQEYVQLVNNNPFAVDVSGWQLGGGVQHTFKAGTVILSSNALYVSPDVVAFRARTSGPRGGQGLLVQGNYQGQLSARGELLTLHDDRQRLVHTNRFNGNPSQPQLYLRVSELMYHPTSLAGNAAGAEEFEFIELKNTSTDTTLNLANVRFVNGVDFNFTASAVTGLAPGETVLIVKNATAFAARYGGGFNIAGQYTGSLENRGERLQLVDASGEEILDFSYNNSWYPITDGFGFSLVVLDENAEPDAWGKKSNWRASGTLGGSPSGNGPTPPVIAAVLVNEALTRSDTPPPTDSIELHNPTGAEANVGGWFLSDDFNTPKKFRITNGTTIAAGGFLVFDESQFNVGATSFGLSSDGDEVWLFSADVAGNLTGYVHGFAFGAAEDDVTFGRHLTSTGEEHFVAQSAMTLTAANAGPRVGPVVINEIMYRPTDLVDGSDNDGEEFIELLNISGGPVALYDSLIPTNTWKITGGVDFVFPTNQTLPAGAYLLVVNFNPTNAAADAAFRGRYGINPSVPLFGPYSGKLDNGGTDVELKKPTTPLAGSVPYVFIDQVEYRDSAPWPAAADGSGASLQRLNSSTYGNDPANWIAAAPSAGNARSMTGTPPMITIQPVSQTLVASTTAMLSVTATGTAPLRYQWRVNGANLPGATNSLLGISNVQGTEAGDYSVLAYNEAGSTVSSNATVSVIYAAFILQQPASVLARIKPDPDAAPATNATFSTIAYSTSPLSYQWRFNGVVIPGAIDSTLTITNVQVTNGGQYICAITDEIGTVFTAPAMLFPLISPTIVQNILTQQVVAGASVTLSVAANGNPIPFSYEWRRGSIPLVTNTVNSRTDFFTFAANPAPFTTNQYRVIVRNLAYQGTLANSLAVIITLPDNDQDGIPDPYETSLGLDTNNVADALGDLDSDGMKNRDEYLAGTDPANPSSYLKIDQSTTPGVAMLHLAAVSNRTYTVQYIDALGGSSWTALASLVARATNRVEQLADQSWTSNRFYRVVLPAQP